MPEARITDEMVVAFAKGADMTDLEELKKLAEAKPVAWTQQSAIDALTDEDAIVAAIWRQRDESEYRLLYDDPDMPDDVPLYADDPAARSALPALIDRVEKAEAEREAALSRLKTYEEVDAELNAKFVKISDANALKATARAEAAEAENARLLDALHHVAWSGNFTCFEDKSWDIVNDAIGLTSEGSAAKARADVLESILGRQS